MCPQRAYLVGEGDHGGGHAVDSDEDNGVAIVLQGEPPRHVLVAQVGAVPCRQEGLLADEHLHGGARRIGRGRRERAEDALAHHRLKRRRRVAKGRPADPLSRATPDDANALGYTRRARLIKTRASHAPRVHRRRSHPPADARCSSQPLRHSAKTASVCAKESVSWVDRDNIRQCEGK